MRIEFSERAKAIFKQGVKENNPLDLNTAPPQRGYNPEPPAADFDFNTAPPHHQAVTVTPENCRARCRKSGLCYAAAAFDGKAGRGVECNPVKCEYLEKQKGGVFFEHTITT